MTNHDDLKRWLVEQLPELIEILDIESLQSHPSYFWKQSAPAICHGEIKDTEWDYITRLVEQKLDAKQIEQYDKQLHMLWIEGRPVERCYSEWKLVLDWPTRARALKEVLK